MKSNNYLAFDFGQSSVKAAVGIYNGKLIKFEEVHRFDNIPVYAAGNLQFDILRLYYELQRGIRKALKNVRDIQSIGIDSWGGVFSFIDKQGHLVGNPVTNCDKRTEGISDSLYRIIPKRELFEITGVHFPASLSSLFQIYSLVLSNSPLLSIADKYQMIPDLINYFLTGTTVCEYTILNIGQLIDIKNNKWSDFIMNKLNIPKHIFPDIVKPGTLIGPIKQEVCEIIDCPTLKVIVPIEHDTPSAFAAVPENTNFKNCVMLSIGTWCVLAIEVEKPILTMKIFESGFKNLKGAENVTYLSKDIAGLWIAKEYRRKLMFKEDRNISWDEIVKIASDSSGGEYFINIENSHFNAPVTDIPCIAFDYLKITGQNIPETKGQLFRCMFESLVLRFRYNIEILEKIIDKKADAIYLIGGGSKNKLLCQWTANLLKIPVVAGIYEATLAGNILAQIRCLGEISSFREGKKILYNSFNLIEYYPEETDKWGEIYKKYLEILKIENNLLKKE